MKSVPLRCLLAVLAIALANAAAIWADERVVAPVVPATVSSFEPLVVIGASASAGFIMSEPFGGPKTSQYRLSRYLDAALLHKGRDAVNLATAPFFLNPDEQGKQQIDHALELQPGTVVGVDFLFWFCYGRSQAETDRPKRFENGLALLDRLKCPVVVGDIPDASTAVGGMLSRAEMPALETIAAANRRLAEWASSHPNVAVLSLSNFMKCCHADRSLTVHGQIWAEGETRKLLQSDRLHPARHGCAILALAVMDALTAQARVLSDPEVRWDANEIYRQVTDAANVEAKTGNGGSPPVPARP